MFKYFATIILANFAVLGTITEVYAANIWTIPIQNGTGGDVNDAHFRFTQKVKNVSIMYGDTMRGCTPTNPDPNGNGLIFDCPVPMPADDFVVPGTGDAAQKRAKLLYESDCSKCKPVSGKNTYWTADGENVGEITVVGATPRISRNSPLSLSLFNEESFSVTYDNIQVFEGNDLINFNLNNFATPTGTLVSGLPTSITLEPNTSTTIDLSFIVEEPSTYVLATASFFPTSNPSEAASFSTAYDFGEEECIPEPSSIIGVFSFGILGAGATLKRKVKRSDSIEKDPTNVS
jgi:hypothetical protein